MDDRTDKILFRFWLRLIDLAGPYSWNGIARLAKPFHVRVLVHN